MTGPATTMTLKEGSNMYWFAIFYYANRTDFVVPLIDTNNYQLEVYAANPKQATAVAKEIINTCDEYDRHLPLIHTLSSCIRDEDLERWQKDKNSAC